MMAYPELEIIVINYFRGFGMTIILIFMVYLAFKWATNAARKV